MGRAANPLHNRKPPSRGGAVAARRAHNPKVTGSSPVPATNSPYPDSWNHRPSANRRDDSRHQVPVDVLSSPVPASPFDIPAQAGRARAPTQVLKSVGSEWGLRLPAPIPSFPRRRESIFPLYQRGVASTHKGRPYGLTLGFEVMVLGFQEPLLGHNPPPLNRPAAFW